MIVWNIVLICNATRQPCRKVFPGQPWETKYISYKICVRMCTCKNITKYYRSARRFRGGKARWDYEWIPAAHCCSAFASSFSGFSGGFEPKKRYIPWEEDRFCCACRCCWYFLQWKFTWSIKCLGSHGRIFFHPKQNLHIIRWVSDRSEGFSITFFPSQRFVFKVVPFFLHVLLAKSSWDSHRPPRLHRWEIWFWHELVHPRRPLDTTSLGGPDGFWPVSLARWVLEAWLFIPDLSCSLQKESTASFFHSFPAMVARYKWQQS